MATYQINDLPEVDLHATLLEVRIPVRVVDEFGQFSLAHLRSSIPKDKEERIYGVGLSRSVGADDRRKRLKAGVNPVEGPYGSMGVSVPYGRGQFPDAQHNS